MGPPRPAPLPERPPKGKLRTDSTYDWREVGEQATLRAVHDFLKLQRYAWEIIVVDDGSTDRTPSVVHNATADIPNLSLIQLPYNLGKGAAVREGMLAARGAARLFTDADNSTPIEEVNKLLPFFEQGYDVVVGSRRIDGAIIHARQQVGREILGACFRVLTRLIVPLPVKDTQNGFKLFSANAAKDLFDNLRTQGWSFRPRSTQTRS